MKPVFSRIRNGLAGLLGLNAWRKVVPFTSHPLLTTFNGAVPYDQIKCCCRTLSFDVRFIARYCGSIHGMNTGLIDG